MISLFHFFIEIKRYEEGLLRLVFGFLLGVETVSDMRSTNVDMSPCCAHHGPTPNWSQTLCPSSFWKVALLNVPVMFRVS